jgi:MFS family permease
MRLSESESELPVDRANVETVSAFDPTGLDSAVATIVPAEDRSPIRVSGLLTVLRNRNFLILWAGQVFSQLADKIYLVMTIAIIESQFQSANQSISGWVSAMMMANTLPAVLLGSLAGVFVDRWHKKEVLVVTNLLRGVLVLATPIVLWMTRDIDFLQLPLGFELLLLITLGVSTLTQFFAPAEQATISAIVDRPNLLSANSLYTTTLVGSLIVGFAIGEPILAWADWVGEIVSGFTNVGKEAIVGGSYAIAGLLLLFIRTGEAKKIAPTIDAHIWQDLREALAYLKQKPRISGAMLQLTIVFSVFAAITVLVVRLAEILPEIKASQFGVLLAAGSVGLGLGALATNPLSRRLSNRKLALLGSIACALALFGLSAVTTNFILTTIALTIVGAAGAFIFIPMQTTIQAETPEEMRGKVFGLQNNAVNIALSLPLALTGVAETALGVPAVCILLGITLLLGGAATWYLTALKSE